MNHLKYILVIAISLQFLACNKDNTVATYHRQVGEPCNEVDNCDSDFICDAGICRVMCQNDDTCTKKEYCKDNVCVPIPGDLCRTGWSGGNCDVCAEDFYGSHCEPCPDCGQHGKCNATLKGDGKCQCDDGWDGPLCNKCAANHYGQECAECPQCGEHGRCNFGLQNDGTCLCDDGFTDEFCDKCSTDHYGPDCQPCNCGAHGSCVTGMDSDGKCTCDDGFTDTYCDSCANPLYGGEDCDECADARFSGTYCNECIDGTTDIMVDKAGKSYRAVCINKQFWLAENLNYSTGVYYYPGDDSANTDTYGLLYDWETATKLCSHGWYLPDAEEYAALQNYLVDSGKKMQLSNSDSCNDELCLLPAGYYGDFEGGGYDGFLSDGYFWTATEKMCLNYFRCAQSIKVNAAGMTQPNNDIYSYQEDGFSVRCVHDSCTDSHFSGKNCDICSNPLKTLESKCRECPSPRFFGDNCDICQSPLMEGSNCDICKNGGYGVDCRDYGSVTIDNDTYRTVVIGDQVWMAENLRIPGTKLGSDYFYPNNDQENVATMGYLYPWSKAKGLCPESEGWYLPTEADFKALLQYVNEHKQIGNNAYYALAAKSPLWSGFYANKGTNEFGFGGLPAGIFMSTSYPYYGGYGYWWTKDVATNDSNDAIMFALGYGSYSSGGYNKTWALSVRCLQKKN